MASTQFYYCGFSDHLPFKDQRDGQTFFRSLKKLDLDTELGRPLKAFIGWCSLYIITDNGKLLFFSYNDPLDRSASLKICNFENPLGIKQIECGPQDTYFLLKDGRVRRWKDGGVVDDERIEALEEKVLALSLGSTFTCFLLHSGVVKAVDTDGSIVTFSAAKRTTSVACGHEHILLLNDKGQIFSYGVGSKGQLGHGSTEDVFEEERLVEALDGVKMVQIAAGGWHSIALSSLGDVYVWGWNESGQIGSSRRETTLQLIPGLLNLSSEITFTSIACGSRHTVLLSRDGKLYGFGWNKWSQLGIDPNEAKQCDAVQLLPSNFKATQISCKYWSTLVA